MARVKYYPEAVKRDVRQRACRALKTAAEMVRNQVVRNISTGRPPSQPGEFPHVDTGHLRQSIFSDTDCAEGRAIVGTPLLYGLYLEVGTEHMAPRPYLSRTLEEMRGQIKPVLEGGG